MASSRGMADALRRLYRKFPPVHRRRFFVVLIVMLCGAVAEVMSLGAVLPFLALMADPQQASEYPILAELFAYFGWSDPADMLLPVTLLFIFLALVASAARILLSRLMTRFVSMLGHALATDVYRRILFQPYSYHLKRNSSESIAAFQLVHSMAQGLLLPAMHALVGVAIGLCLVALMAFIDPVLVPAAFVIFGSVYYFVGRATKRVLHRGSETLASTYTRRVQVVQEGLGGIRDVVLDDAQLAFLARFEEPDEAYSRARATADFIGEFPRYAIEAVGMSLIALLALGVSTRAGGLDAGLPLLGALALGSQKLLPLMQRVYVAQTTIRANWHLLHEVLELLELPIAPKSGPGAPLTFTKSMEFDSVGFQYDLSGPVVLKDIKFRLAKGSRLGIIGATGSGKSTLMDLLMGLLRPSTGTIRVDEVEIDEETSVSWQANIAHVPQMIFLADASLADNIAFGVPASEVDIERVKIAARKAKLHGFIENLSEGYNTLVGERGVRLSGGQRQRVGIARALYKGANVLVFDEATSALDADTEAAVMDAILALGPELTLIIVAHRLATVAGCDQVLRVEDGEIVDRGSYESVVNNGSTEKAPPEN